MLKKGEQNEITSLVTLNINFKTQPFQSTERNLKIMYFSKQPVYICSQLLDHPKCSLFKQKFVPLYLLHIGVSRCYCKAVPVYVELRSEKEKTTNFYPAGSL